MPLNFIKDIYEEEGIEARKQWWREVLGRWRLRWKSEDLFEVDDYAGCC